MHERNENNAWQISFAERDYFVGQEYNVRIDFRTNKLNGILLSISNPEGHPALAFEVLDGRVSMGHAIYHCKLLPSNMNHWPKSVILQMPIGLVTELVVWRSRVTL
jgi:hypothetical protein